MMKTALPLIVAFLLFTVVPAGADDTPPADARPLSQVIHAIEARNLGTITEVEFDDDVWEFELYQGDTKIKLDVDPRTAEIVRRKTKSSAHDTLPPQDAKPLSEIVKSLEDQQLGTLTEVEFDAPHWEVKLRKDGKKMKLRIDPRTGEPAGRR